MARAKGEVELEVELQEQILVTQEVIAGGQLALALDAVGHHGEVVVGGVGGGELRHARLQ